MDQAVRWGLLLGPNLDGITPGSGTLLFQFLAEPTRCSARRQRPCQESVEHTFLDAKIDPLAGRVQTCQEILPPLAKRSPSFVYLVG